MDLRTGRTYESKEAALAAGVPESDVAEVLDTPNGPTVRIPFVPDTNPKHPTTHQGKRELARRLAKEIL